MAPMEILGTKCEVCASKDAKYTCPACSTHTCSLPCVNQHKTETPCNGRPTKKIKPISFHPSRSALAKEGEETLQTDLEFLFQGIDTVNSCHVTSGPIPHKNKLVQGAKKVECTLMVMPPEFSRHARNTSRMSKQDILWRVEVVRHDSKELIHAFDNCNDKETELAALLKPFGTEFELEIYQGPRVKIDLSQTLRDMLRGKTIVEFPTLFLLV